MVKRSKKLLEADKFRVTVQQLRSFGDIYREWEADWLDTEAARRDDYVYTDKERIILNQILAAAKPFEGYNGWSVMDLLRIVYRYRGDLDEDNEEFVERLWRLQPKMLPVRQLCRLVDLARMTELIGRDEEVDLVMRETRAKDDSVHEVPEFVPYT